MDVMTDSLYNGRRFRALTIVDTMTRESPAIEVDGSFSSTRVVAVLARLAATQGLPKVIYVNNGPEFVAKARARWAHQRGVKRAVSRPEEHQRTIHVLRPLMVGSATSVWITTGLPQSRMRGPSSRHGESRANTVRPHTALQHLVPAMYKATWMQTQQAGSG